MAWSSIRQISWIMALLEKFLSKIHVMIHGTPLDYYYDINRDGNISPVDLLRFRQLIFGSCPALQEWAGVCLQARP